MKPLERGRTFLFRIAGGTDFLEGMAAFCKSQGIRTAVFQAIGSATKAVLGVFNLSTRQFDPLTLEGRVLEIVSCQGNVSLKEGDPLVHAHLLVSDRQGHVLAGHALPGIDLVVLELYLQELTGEVPVRVLDPDLDLYMWLPEKVV